LKCPPEPAKTINLLKKGCQSIELHKSSGGASGLFSHYRVSKYQFSPSILPVHSREK
jgi:hypothetical protein